MNGKSNRASGRSEKTRRQKKPLDLVTARKMLPLIKQIVTDIVQDQTALTKYTFEQEGLERDKRNLSWPERDRRYTLEGEVTRLQSRLDEERKELDRLGAVLLNTGAGQVGFPTLINGHPAYYSWQLGEDTVSFWHFDGESDRRPIPPTWTEGAAPRRVGQH